VKLLNKKIIKKIIKKKLTLSVAESCTGGLLSKIITSYPGTSKIFHLGLITYSNGAKINVLKVPKKIIEKHGSVSEQVCISMVKNLSKISKSDISLSVTGIAGPSGGSKKKPVGLVYIAIKRGNKIKSIKCLFKNKNRHNIQNAAANKSLKLISANIK